MRAVLLPRFLQSQTVVLVGATGLALLIVLIAVLVSGALDAAAGPIQIAEPNPFRWT